MPHVVLKHPQGRIDPRLHGHLAHADALVFEMDGYFLDPQTNFFSHIAHLDLEDIIIGMNSIQFHFFQRAGLSAFESSCCIFRFNTQNKSDPNGIYPPA
jgi:hypothetical protein